MRLLITLITKMLQEDFFLDLRVVGFLQFTLSSSSWPEPLRTASRRLSYYLVVNFSPLSVAFLFDLSIPVGHISVST